MWLLPLLVLLLQAVNRDLFLNDELDKVQCVLFFVSSAALVLCCVMYYATRHPLMRLQNDSEYEYIWIPTYTFEVVTWCHLGRKCKDRLALVLMCKRFLYPRPGWHMLNWYKSVCLYHVFFFSSRARQVCPLLSLVVQWLMFRVYDSHPWDRGSIPGEGVCLFFLGIHPTASFLSSTLYLVLFMSLNTYSSSCYFSYLLCMILVQG